MVKSFSVLCAVIFLASFSSCQKKTVPPPPPVPVTAVRVVPQTIPADFEYVGVGKSSHIVELRARVEGYLEKIAYQEGSLVHEGDLMFVIDQRPFIAVLEEAKGELARQQAVLWNAQQSKNRMVPLYKENAVSQKDLDDAIANELAAEASVMTAEANVMKAQINLDFTTIQAPVTGMSSDAKFREGALISPGPDSLLTNIYVIDPIWVYFSVSEGDILKARDESLKGKIVFPKDMNFNIQIVFADGTIFPAVGKIDFTNPSLQQSTGTMMIRVILDNPKGWLKPGQFVRVMVKGAVRPNAIIVPQTAVQQGQNGVYVYVVTKDSKAALRPVKPGDWYKNYWIIESGLQSGDIVISEGVNKVQNNTPVSVKTWAPDAPSDNQQPDLNNIGF